MSKGNRFTEEFKLEAVKQVVERGLLILKSYNKHRKHPVSTVLQ